MPAPLLNIGTSPAAVKELHAAILAILRAPDCAEQTKREALRTLRHGVALNASLTGCNFTGGAK